MKLGGVVGGGGVVHWKTFKSEVLGGKNLNQFIMPSQINQIELKPFLNITKSTTVQYEIKHLEILSIVMG